MSYLRRPPVVTHVIGVPEVVFYGLLVRERVHRRPPPQQVVVQYVYVQPPPPPQVVRVWAPLPLAKVHVAVQAFDFCAEVTVTQTYRNESACVLDSEYIFPLDEGSAVSAFSARIGDRIIHGQVREKAAARAQFEQAKAAGKATALMEQRAENVFKVSIGNLDARSEITITITYVTTLELVGKANTIVIPSVVAPKYEPHRYYGWNGHLVRGGGNSNDGFYNAPAAPQLVTSGVGQLNFFQSMTAQYMGVAPPPVVVVPAPVVIAAVQQVAPPRRFSMQIDLLMPARIASIVSESHAAQTRVTIDALPDGVVVAADGRLAVPHHARVTFGMDADGAEGIWPESLGDKDFVLNITQAAYLSTRAVLEVDPATGSQAVQLAFCPPSLDMLDASALRTEVIFLVDQSGSMAGSGIDAVKQLLQLFIRSLPIYSRLNIVSFGSTYRKLFAQSAAYSESSINQALAYVGNMKADLGGTEIMDPLKHCFEAPVHQDYPRQIFLLTDGQVSNTQQLVDLTRSHCYQSRLFAFGLGNSVDRVLVKSLAAAGKGQHEFVGALNTPEAKSELASKVMRNLIRAMQPSLSGVKVDWSALRGPAPASGGGGFMGFGGPKAPKVQQCPEQIAPIFAPAREIIYALDCTVPLPAAGGPEQVVTIRVSAQSNRPRNGEGVEGKVSWDVPLNLSRPQSGTFIHKLAARARIGELQGMSTSRWGSNSEAQQRQQVLALALKFQLLSNYTSFILVDDRRIASLKDPNRVRRGARRHPAAVAHPAIQPALAGAQVDMFNAFMASQLTPGLPVNSNGFAFQTVGGAPPAPVASAPPAAPAAAAAASMAQPVIVQDGADDDYSSDDDEDNGEYEAEMVDLSSSMAAQQLQQQQQQQQSYGGGGGGSYGAAPSAAPKTRSSSSSSFSTGSRGGGRGGFGGGDRSSGGNGDGGLLGSIRKGASLGSARGGGGPPPSAAKPMSSSSSSAAPVSMSSLRSRMSSSSSSSSSSNSMEKLKKSSSSSSSSPSPRQLQRRSAVQPSADVMADVDPEAEEADNWDDDCFSFAAAAAPSSSAFAQAFAGPPAPPGGAPPAAPAAASAPMSSKRKKESESSSSNSSSSGMTLSTAFTILIQMVAVDGCWNASRELLQLLVQVAKLSNQSGEVQASLSSMTVESLTALSATLRLSSVKVAATLMVSWTFSSCFAARQMEWAMMDAKAKGAMRATMGLNIADIPTITAKLIPGSSSA